MIRATRMKLIAAGSLRDLEAEVNAYLTPLDGPQGQMNIYMSDPIYLNGTFVVQVMIETFKPTA